VRVSGVSRAARVLAGLAEKPWSGASVAFYGQKTDFSGDFQRPNLTMREKLTAKSFAQALIPNGLQIICKDLREICAPCSRGGHLAFRGWCEPGPCLTD
jgi:hypothetical protein